MKVALYLRVSKDDESQNPENQLEPLRNMARALSGEIVEEYTDMASGGNSNRPQFQKMLHDAAQHKFNLILVWSLDRFSREGILHTLSYIDNLKRAKVNLRSLQEPWVDISDEGVGEIIIAVLSWVAKRERIHRSERTKAGLALKKSQGVILGRRLGSKDKGRRIRRGYNLRWDREGQKV